MRSDILFPRVPIDIPDEMLENIGGFIPEDILASYIAEELEKVRKDELWIMAKDHFLNEDDTPWEMSPGELAMFRAILLREHPRVEICSSTQYGKTITVARAVLERIASYPEDWLLVVPDTKRGKILLNYMIKDSYNNTYFRDKLVGTNLAEKTALNRLLEEKSKVKLTFQVIDEDGELKYSSVTVVSCDARRKQDAINTIMGFGGRNVIQEEASLESNEVDAGIFRMLAGKGEDTFLCKIGNPFYRNHFFKTWRDRRYMKVFIDYKIGLLEGRYVQSFIDEARLKPKFDILFECRFPAEDQIDSEGWSNLITETELKRALTDDWNPFGIGSLGADPAGEGANESLIVQRWRNIARIKFADAKIDGVDFCGKISDAIDEDKIDVRTCALDKVGVGAALPGIMKGIGKPVMGVNVGESCEMKEDQAQFANKRAKLAWDVKLWISGGGKLLRDNRWYQLLNVKYKEDSKRRMILMSKKEMLKKGIASPDAFDGLCLTFARPQVFYKKSLEQDFFDRKMRQKRLKNKKKPFRMVG